MLTAHKSETFKYLYLLFEDATVLPLSSECVQTLMWSIFLTIHLPEYVFNTEVSAAVPTISIHLPLTHEHRLIRYPYSVQPSARGSHDGHYCSRCIYFIVNRATECGHGEVRLLLKLRKADTITKLIHPHQIYLSRTGHMESRK